LVFASRFSDTVFAREVLEASIIIGQYRTVLLRSDNWQGEKQAEGLKCITNSALIAAGVAVLVVLAVAIPLGVLSQDLDEKTADIIEGVSKVVAAICILQLSLKIPKWLGVYKSKKHDGEGVVVGLSLKSIRFNVMWNIWREVAEIGVFLIPFFLGEGAIAIPLSALAGIALALVVGALIYYGNKKLERKGLLVFFMSGLTGFLSIGLFVGGCHEFEEALGETAVVWKIQNDFWSHKKLPMVLLKPFGYSAKRTQLQIACFWTWLTLTVVLHLWKWWSSKKMFESEELAEGELAEAKLAKGSQQLESDSSGSNDIEAGGETSNPDNFEDEQ